MFLHKSAVYRTAWVIDVHVTEIRKHQTVKSMSLCSARGLCNQPTSELSFDFDADAVWKSGHSNQWFGVFGGGKIGWKESDCFDDHRPLQLSVYLQSELADRFAFKCAMQVDCINIQWRSIFQRNYLVAAAKATIITLHWSAKMFTNSNKNPQPLPYHRTPPNFHSLSPFSFLIDFLIISVWRHYQWTNVIQSDKLVFQGWL